MGSWEIVSDSDITDAVLGEVRPEDLHPALPGERKDDKLDEFSDFDLLLDDLPVAELEEEELRLDDEPDSIAKDE